MKITVHVSEMNPTEAKGAAFRLKELNATRRAEGKPEYADIDAALAGWLMDLAEAWVVAERQDFVNRYHDKIMEADDTARQKIIEAISKEKIDEG